MALDVRCAASDHDLQVVSGGGDFFIRNIGTLWFCGREDCRFVRGWDLQGRELPIRMEFMPGPVTDESTKSEDRLVFSVMGPAVGVS